MEIFYNELSNHPLADNQQDARARILTLLETMKYLRNHDINIMRTHNGFYAEQLCESYSFLDFFNDPKVHNDLKILLRTITASPFIKDDDSDEADDFILGKFETKNERNEIVIPEGLACAYLCNAPTISISSHDHWRNNLLLLHVTYEDDIPVVSKDVNIQNIHSLNCLRKDGFRNWLNEALNHLVLFDSEEHIYRVFPRDKYLFERKAINDLISWNNDDKKRLSRIKELIEDIEMNPFQRGKGKTECLLSGNKASKRITKKDRIVYTYTSSIIIIHQCKGHYDDT